MQIDTAIGRVDIADLDVSDVVTLTDTTRIVRTEWHLKSTRELVRADNVVQILRGVEAEPESFKGH